MAGRFKLTVHRPYRNLTDPWLLTCPGLAYYCELKSRDLEEAKCQALALVQVELQKAVDAVLDSRTSVVLSSGKVLVIEANGVERTMTSDDGVNWVLEE